jgi:DNA-binding transcriptional ArsR family regulator
MKGSGVEATSSRMDGMDDGALGEVAAYFRALAEPSRLKLLNALRDGERNVTELAAALGGSQANASKHLAVLLGIGAVERATRGTSAYYRIADPSTYRLCDLVCGQIGRRFEAESALRRGFIAASRSGRGR